MDEMSWQARLAKQNINILIIDDDERWFYEFMYHPYSGSTKWCKTYYYVPTELRVPKDDPKRIEKAKASIEKIADGIIKEVAKLRRELEK